MDVVLLRGLYFASSIVDLRERIEGLEILDVRGHEIDWRDLLGQIGAGGAGGRKSGVDERQRSWCWCEGAEELASGGRRGY